MALQLLKKAGLGLALFSSIMTAALASPVDTAGALPQLIKFKKFSAPVTDISTIKPGTKLEIVLFRDGLPLRAKYLGTAAMTEEAYAEKYDQARRSLAGSVGLPNLGDSISLVDRRSVAYEGTFRGFDKGLILLERNDDEKPSRVNLAMIETFQVRQESLIDTNRLIDHLNHGLIPFRTTIIYEARGDRWETPIDEIERMSVRNSHTGVKAFAAIIGGLSILGLILIFTLGNPSWGEWFVWQ